MEAGHAHVLPPGPSRGLKSFALLQEADCFPLQSKLSWGGGGEWSQIRGRGRCLRTGVRGTVAPGAARRGQAPGGVLAGVHGSRGHIHTHTHTRQHVYTQRDIHPPRHVCKDMQGPAHTHTRTDIHQHTHIHTLTRAHTPRYQHMHAHQHAHTSHKLPRSEETGGPV